MRPTFSGRFRVSALSAGGPRDLAAIRDGLAAAATLGRHPGARRRSASRASRRICAAPRRLRRACGRARDDACRRIAPSRARGRVRAARGLGRARRGAEPARRKPPRHCRAAGDLRRAGGSQATQDQAQQFSRLLHRNPAGGGRNASQGPAQFDLHPSPDNGRGDALHHQRAGRPRGAHRLRRRPRARARTRSVRTPSPGVPRRGRPPARLWRGAGRDRRRRRARRTCGEAQLDPSAHRRFARVQN